MTRSAKLVLGAPDGEHIVVVAWGRGYPGGLTPYDDNWLMTDVTARGATAALRYRAFVRTKDFASFHCDLQSLLAGEASRARLNPRDPWVTAEVTPDGVGWRVELCARDNGTGRSVEFVCALDRAALEVMARELEALVAEYPVLR